MCDLLGLDPAVYFTETDPERQAIRDAAATVLYEIRAQEAEEAERRRARQQQHRL